MKNPRYRSCELDPNPSANTSFLQPTIALTLSNRSRICVRGEWRLRFVLRRKEQMLRISTAEERPKEVTLRLEGRLASGWIRVLKSECQQWIGQGKRVVLDFSGVTSIDDRGARFARSLQKRLSMAPTVARSMRSKLSIPPR